MVMIVNIVSAKDIAKGIVKDLGLNPECYAVTSIEVLSALIRRTTGLLCPCTRKKVLKNVIQSLEGVIPNHSDLKNEVNEIISMLIAHGDLIEHNDTTRDLTRREFILNRAPMAFVKRESGACILLGVSPDDRPVLPDYLQEKILYNNFTRVITVEADPDIQKHLLDIGFIEFPSMAWTKYPQPIAAEKHIAYMRKCLMSSSTTTEIIEGLRILDSATNVDYYPDRWVLPHEHTGMFIGRRPQSYGSDLWCYVELMNGKPKRFLDLPLPGSVWSGADEAWHLQAAIDSFNGRPQHYRINDRVDDCKIFDLFSPIPSWAQRRWVMLGISVPRNKCLMSFRFRSVEIEEEIRFAKEHLWLSEKIE